MAYYFSRDRDVFSQSTVQKSIMAIRELMEKMGYSVYDEKKNYTSESTV